MSGNDFVTFFLRTPLHVLMGDTMLITVTGCRTGKKYSTPVSFFRDGDCLWVMTSRIRTWWRNVKNGAEVTLLLNGRTVSAFAEAELSEKEIEARLLDYLRHTPMVAKPLGIRMENKIPNGDDIRHVAKDRVFVKIKLQ